MRRIVLDLFRSKREIASAGRIGLSTAAGVVQSRTRRIDLSTAMLNQSSSNKCPSLLCNKNRFSTNTHHEIECTDVADLLSTPDRNFLVGSHGQKVPVSSLKGKLVGLYLCERIPQPPRMEAIKKVYEKAKRRGFDFEIVQITFDFNATDSATKPLAPPFCDDLLWLSLPILDQTFTKIQQIFQFDEDADDDDTWDGDSLVLIHPPDDSGDTVFEFSGAEILDYWGIKGYPFTRASLYKAEYKAQKREVTLQRVFPPGGSLRCPLPSGDGFVLVGALPRLSGKRVLVLFAEPSFGECNAKFLSMLKSEYEAQPEDSKFEVVYVSIGCDSSFFDEFTKDMPWLVLPFRSLKERYRFIKLFKPELRGMAAMAFDERGQLIAKEDRLDQKEVFDLRFPFIDPDLEKRIRLEVEELCG